MKDELCFLPQGSGSGGRHTDGQTDADAHTDTHTDTRTQTHTPDTHQTRTRHMYTHRRTQMHTWTHEHTHRNRHGHPLGRTPTDRHAHRTRAYTQTHRRAWPVVSYSKTVLAKYRFSSKFLFAFLQTKILGCAVETGPAGGGGGSGGFPCEDAFTDWPLSVPTAFGCSNRNPQPGSRHSVFVRA